MIGIIVRELCITRTKSKKLHPMFEFKPYHDSDEVYLWDTYVQAMKPHIKNIWGWEDDWQKKDFVKKLDNYQTFLLKFENSNIGYVQFKNNSKDLFINMLILSPSWQSKGFGKSVLDQLLTSNSNKKLSLRCFKVNQSAYDFYQREGFSVIGSDDNFFMLEKDFV